MIQVAGILVGLAMVLMAFETFQQSTWGVVSILGLLILAIVLLIIAYRKRDRNQLKMDGPVGRHF